MVRAQALYEERGYSFRKIAKLLVGQTEYASWKVMSVQLNVQANRRGWKIRNRIEATVAASTRHGLAPRKKTTPAQRAYQRRQRQARGETRLVRCKSLTVAGNPCKRWALADSEFCLGHDPERRDQVLANLEAARAASRPAGRVVDESGRLTAVLR